MINRDSFLDGFAPADAGNNHGNGYREELDPFISALYDEGMYPGQQVAESSSTGDSFLDGFDPGNDITTGSNDGSSTMAESNAMTEAEVDAFIQAGIETDGDREFWEAQRQRLLSGDDDDDDLFLELEDDTAADQDNEDDTY